MTDSDYGTCAWKGKVVLGNLKECWFVYSTKTSWFYGESGWSMYAVFAVYTQTRSVPVECKAYRS
jgi:hypothetical protein